MARLSYDLPYALRNDLPASQAVIVYLDDISHTELKQTFGEPWDRNLHAQLIERLTKDGAKAIVFDVLFSNEASTNQEADAHLAREMKENGRVFIGSNFYQRETQPGAFGRWVELPFAPFREAAAGWGNINLQVDPDFGVRDCFPNLENIAEQAKVPWLPWAVAEHMLPAGRKLPPENQNRWINYLGPPGTLPSISYFLALKPEGAPPNFFKDKIVFVGALLSADFAGKGKDEFRTPYAYWRKGFAAGVEIHATATLNLLQGNWLNRLPAWLELTLVVLVGGLAGFGLMRLQPIAAVVFAVATVLVIASAACLLVWQQFIWLNWLLLMSQVGIGLVCSVSVNSLQLYIEGRLLEESLSAHLPPTLVRQVMENPTLRQLGGKQQEISILFTDVANFSRISETVHPDDLVRLMNKYFETALACVHETDGTVVNLVGDCVFAIWNAPVAQPDHRERACRTALLLREKVVEFTVSHLHLPLRTRVGVHGGPASVGNIGSSVHFDYTALGDNINLTSRLEGLNKFLGTSVLVTREIQRAVENSMVWRALGHFQFKGLGRVCEVYELIGPLGGADPTRAYREQFARGLQEFCLRRFDAAAESFEKTIELRRKIEPQYNPGTTVTSADGPSRFYLETIEEFRAHPPAREWIGQIELKEK